jgi:hypothetical protein
MSWPDERMSTVSHSRSFVMAAARLAAALGSAHDGEGLVERKQRDMDYCAWVNSQRGKAPPVTEWDRLPPPGATQMAECHAAGGTRRTW